MTKPITPAEVTQKSTSRIPSQVFEAFNECIQKHWDGRAASFTQNKVIAAILAKMPDTERSTIFENRWLDIEGSYKAVGWRVEYDKPGYCEDYEATFTFKRRTR